MSAEHELSMLMRCTKRLREIGEAPGGATEKAELLDELDVLRMHADSPAVKQRCMAAIDEFSGGGPALTGSRIG